MEPDTLAVTSDRSSAPGGPGTSGSESEAVHGVSPTPPAARRLGRPRDEALGDRRREEILDAATVVFAEDGYRCTDVQKIADRAGVGKGTVYRYFGNKEGLFLAAADRGMRLLRCAVDGAAATVEDPLEKIEVAVRAYLAFFEARPRLVELLIQERAEFPQRESPTYFEHRAINVVRWRGLYERLMDDGRIRRMSVDRITEVFGNLMYGTMFTNYFTGRHAGFEEQAAAILDVVFHGILTAREGPGRTTTTGGEA
jgi:AcrR family transcriptional regulator